MKDLIDYIHKRHFVKLGNYSFSPIMEASAGIALEYCKKLEKEKCDKSPLFFCFPEKKGASLWTSIAILTEYFYEDAVNNEVDGIEFKRNDKVKIFNCIAQVEKVTSEKVYLKFKDQGGIPINQKLRSQLSKVTTQRSLNSKNRFSINYSEAKTKRNTISKILEPDESISINQNNLNSKILLVTGRGNVQLFRDLLHNIEIYNEPLSKVFIENKNLLFTPDLKGYKDLFNTEKMNEFSEFKKFLKRLADLIDLEDVKLRLNELIKIILIEETISVELDNLFLSFFHDYSNEIPQLKFLEKKYPGYQELLPQNLRAVVINDIQQIIDYPNTIKGFLEKKIPVIFISNRNIQNTTELDLYKRLFNNKLDYYRINWNKGKITALIDCEKNVEYIDKTLWSQCKRYAKQDIKITVEAGNELDILAPRIVEYIRELDSYERLQKSFYNFFYPALYALKNSSHTNAQIKKLILEFQKVFNEVKSFGISQEIIHDIEKTIRLALDFKDNTKTYSISGNVFTNRSSTFPNEEIIIPVEMEKINIPDAATESILFTGYPYHEYSGKYLFNSVCLDFIPDIQIICWPKEASLTQGYLKRRIIAGYFNDFLEGIVSLKSEYLLKDETDFKNEISTFFKLDSKIPNESNQEESLEYLYNFKYKGYSGHVINDNSFKVKCNILNFDDGSFMFLPKQSTILAQVESNRGNIKINKNNFHDLNIGSKIFKYIKDRSTYREISKHDREIEGYFLKLERWKDILESLYNASNNNLDTLERLLSETKQTKKIDGGNPCKTSIQRWLFDEEIIKPDNANLRIILHAFKIENIEEKLNELDIAYRKVLSYTIGLSSNIKKNIAKQITSQSRDGNNFFININGCEIEVETRTISSLDKNEIEVDYHNTRKILC